MALFLFSSKLPKTLSVRLIHFFIFSVFFEFFWVFFLNFFPTPGFALCCYFIAKLPFPTALPPTHPLWVENPTDGGWGGAGVGDTKPPAPAGAMRQPPQGRRRGNALGRRPRSEGDMRAEVWAWQGRRG